LKRLTKSPATAAATPSVSGGDTELPPRPGALRARLIAVVAVALSPLLVLSAVQAVLEYGDDTITRRDRLAASVYRAVDRAAQVVEGARPLLEAINAQSGIVAGGPRCSDVLRTALLGTREYRDFIRFGPDGRVACSALRTGPEAEDAVLTGPWFDELLD
jgi:hypothetical protein